MEPKLKIPNVSTIFTISFYTIRSLHICRLSRYKFSVLALLNWIVMSVHVLWEFFVNFRLKTIQLMVVRNKLQSGIVTVSNGFWWRVRAQMSPFLRKKLQYVVTENKSKISVDSAPIEITTLRKLFTVKIVSMPVPLSWTCTLVYS